MYSSCSCREHSHSDFGESTSVADSIASESSIRSCQPELQLILCHCLQLHSAQEFQDIIEHNPGSLIVLMCKAQGCRPCKMFSRKFQRLAEQFSDAIFLEIMGDETSDTRVSPAVLTQKISHSVNKEALPVKAIAGIVLSLGS